VPNARVVGEVFKKRKLIFSCQRAKGEHGSLYMRRMKRDFTDAVKLGQYFPPESAKKDH
jgi:hypothetical protein